MGIKIGINGFGRIGRVITSIAANDPDKRLEIVAINDLSSPAEMAHLLKYDSVHGKFNGEIKVGKYDLTINGKKISVSSEKDPSKIKWGESKVEIVLECTGILKGREDAAAHLRDGVKYVLVSAPSKGADATICYGINDEIFDPKSHKVISNASCTTNCVAPIAKILHDEFGISLAMMTTIHSYTNDQRLLDTRHSDFRRARAAALSMIPTSTGATKAVEEILPDLKGKITGVAIRVPTPNVSVVDLTALLNKAVTVEKINSAFKKASSGKYSKVLSFSEEPLVSIDFNGSPYSSIIDSALTQVCGEKLVKVFAWYDNEVGFSNRMIDLAYLIGKKAKLA